MLSSVDIDTWRRQRMGRNRELEYTEEQLRILPIEDLVTLLHFCICC